jgi:hypothetical protein
LNILLLLVVAVAVVLMVLVVVLVVIAHLCKGKTQVAVQRLRINLC